MKKTNKIKIIVLVIAGTLWSIGPALAAGPVEEDRDKSLTARLSKSEEQVEALKQRIEQLERQLNALSTTSMYRANMSLGSQAQSVAQAPPSPPPSQSPVAEEGRRTSRAGGQAAGAFEVDEAAAQRALERTLTQAGALVLPSGTYELTPNFRYVRLEQTFRFPTTLTDPGTGTRGPALASRRSRSNHLTAALDLRAGLPLDSQLEVSLPFNHVRASEVDDFANATSDNASGMGDISVGLARTFFRERGFRPDLVGRLTYNAGNGKRQSGMVGFNAGFRELQAEVVALKRQDPLAFTASLFYSKVFEEDSIKPGNGTGLTLGATLAASPATSLQFAFSQVYRQKQELNGIKLRGTEQTYGVLTLGASSVLSRSTTLVSQFGIGLGNDAPNYSISVRLPILFY
jgi:hypothetical protein